MGAATNFILPAILQTILGIGLLSYYNPFIGLLAFSIFPGYILISHYSTKKWAVFETKKNKVEDNYKSRITEVIQNMKLVKTTNTQVEERSTVESLTKKFVKIYDHQSVGYHWINFVRNILLETVLIVIVILTFRDTFNQVITLGTMVLIIQLLNQLRRPLFAMSFILERIQKANAGAKEYFEIISIPATESLPKTKPSIKHSSPTLRLEKVSFTYESTPVLKNVSLHINPGENVAIIGPSGAGKTTLVNLLLRLYEPDTGSIYIEDDDYTALDHATIRAHYSYVFQDNELFSSTVLENVAYGHKLSDNQVISALKSAHAYDFVMNFPDKLKAQIGERGVKLSGGQKQRLQIARALANPAPILILDEATSSLDAKSEHLVQQALLAATHTKTVIIIAHRFSTLQHVDRIVVIDNGQIVDQGAPSDLAIKPGIFKDLLRYQIEGNQKLLEKYDIIS
jgi:ATP-binding cassette, subfamily B, bacterial